MACLKPGDPLSAETRPIIVLSWPICLFSKAAAESGFGAVEVFAYLGEPTIGAADPDFFSFAAHEIYAFIPVAPNFVGQLFSGSGRPQKPYQYG